MGVCCPPYGPSLATMKESFVGKQQITIDVPVEFAIRIAKDRGRFNLEPSPAWQGADHGRFLLNGRNPVGTAPVFGVVALDPVWSDDQAAVNDRLFGGDAKVKDASRTVLSISVIYDPAIAPGWQPQQLGDHLDLVAQSIAANLSSTIQQEWLRQQAAPGLDG